MGDTIKVVPTRTIALTEKLATTLAKMGLAYPAGSEERAAASLLLAKFQNAPETAAV